MKRLFLFLSLIVAALPSFAGGPNYNFTGHGTGGTSVYPSTAQVLLDAGARISTVTFSDGSILTSSNSITNPILIAAYDAPDSIKKYARYVCDGTNDYVEIQNAISSLKAYSGGGRIELSRGNFYLGGQITARGAMQIKGAGVYATSIHNRVSVSSYNALNMDMFVSSPTSTQGFFVLSDVIIYGYDLSGYGDTIGQIKSESTVTNLIKGSNTNDDGIIYLSVIDDGGGTTNYYVNFYADLARTNLVGHTTNYLKLAKSKMTIYPDGTYPLTGKIGVGMGTGGSAASTSIYLQGNATGYAIHMGTNSWDTTLKDLMIFNGASGGIYVEEGWGLVVENVITEFCSGDGIKSNSFGKFSNIKSMDNTGHGMWLGSGNMVTNVEVSGSRSAEIPVHTTGKAGLYLNGSGNVISSLRAGTRLGNYGIYIGGVRNTLNSCGITGTTGETGTGISLAAVENIISGCNIYNLGTYGIRIEYSNQTITGSHVDLCATGISMSGSYNRATGNRISNSTTIGLSQSMYSIVNGNYIEGGAIGISIADGRTGLVEGNFFDGAQTTIPVSDNATGSGTCTLRGNVGAPNYEPGQYCKVSANYTVLASSSGVTFVVTTGSTVTLPSTAIGLRYRIYKGSKTATYAINISPAAADRIDMIGNTGTDNKDLINTLATAVSGDYVDLVADGVNGWMVQDFTGQWAYEP